VWPPSSTSAHRRLAGRVGLAAGRRQRRLQALYRRLLATTGRIVGQAKRFAHEIMSGVKRSGDVMVQAVLDGLKQELEVMLPRVQQVMRQARGRVLGGDTRVDGKLVSLFEPTTEIIRKGKASKPTEFGKLVKIQEAEQQIIIDYEVYTKRPSDSELLVPAIAVHQQRLGRVPDVVAADAGFYSAAAEMTATGMGSNGCRCPTGARRVASGSSNKRSAGSKRPRNGGRAARAASVC
jgi:IS5 family transposase